MFRALLRLVVVLVVLVAAAAFFLGYWGSNRLHPSDRPSTTVGTTGRVDTERARETGAAVGEKTAEAANKAGALLADGALTTKIKSKMALDDTVRARTIDVSTSGHVVTVGGHVRSETERNRALQLARETAGVTQVIDHLTVDAR
jgi:hyperosmotically inducible protein